MQVEGLMETPKTNAKLVSAASSEANDQKLRELLEWEPGEKPQ